MDALLAAAMAAGACDEADGFVAGNLPPTQMHWGKTLKEGAVNDDPDMSDKKRCRPSGLMTSAAAKQMVLDKKKQKTA